MQGHERSQILAAITCPEQKARLRSAGGDVASLWMSALPTSCHKSMTDPVFRMAGLLRLGVPILEWRKDEAPPRCAHVNAAGESCGAELDCWGVHACVCKFGPGVSVKHKAVQIVTAARAAGYATVTEAVVPELGLRRRRRKGKTCWEEAVMDVKAYGAAFGPDLHVDVTSREPRAKHVLEKAAEQSVNCIS